MKIKQRRMMGKYNDNRYCERALSLVLSLSVGFLKIKSHSKSREKKKQFFS